MKNLNKQNFSVQHFIAFLPVALIALQSYFKSDVLNILQNTAFSPWGSEVIYWILRATLLIAFIILLTSLPLNHFWQEDKPVDLYEKNRSALDPLLGLRALACINVFFGHWFMVVFGPTSPPQESTDHALRLILSFSPWCGVWIFFTLSGYLMGKGFATCRHLTNKEGLFRFYYNRIRRIFPIYFISIFIISVLVKPEMLDLRNMSAWNSFLASALFDDQGGGAIGALWSVSTEFQFYLLAPFLFLLLLVFSKSTKLLTILAAFVLTVLIVAKYKTLNTHPELWHSRVYFPVLSNLDCFIAGMITAIIVNNIRLRNIYLKNGLQFGIYLTIISQIIFSTWSFHEMASYQGYPGSQTRIYFLSIAPAVTAAFTSLIILLFEISERSESSGNIFWKTSTFFGSITYCLYVLHEPVFLSIRKLFPPNISIFQSIFIFPFGFLLSVGIACIFYYLIEKHFDKIPYSRIRTYFNLRNT